MSFFGFFRLFFYSVLLVLGVHSFPLVFGRFFGRNQLLNFGTFTSLFLGLFSLVFLLVPVGSRGSVFRLFLGLFHFLRSEFGSSFTRSILGNYCLIKILLLLRKSEQIRSFFITAKSGKRGLFLDFFFSIFPLVFTRFVGSWSSQIFACFLLVSVGFGVRSFRLFSGFYSRFLVVQLFVCFRSVFRLFSGFSINFFGLFRTFVRLNFDF